MLTVALAKRGIRANLVDPSAPEDLSRRDHDAIKALGGPLYRIYRRRFAEPDPEPDDPPSNYKHERGLAYDAAVKGASAVLGYRPCAATVAIVDHAVKRRRRFAILPCSGRRGRRVASGVADAAATTPR